MPKDDGDNKDLSNDDSTNDDLNKDTDNQDGQNSDSDNKSPVTDSKEFKDVVKESMKRKAKLQEQDDLLKAESEAKKALATELENFKKQFDGIDPEAVKKLMSERKAAEVKELESKGEYQRIIDQVNKEHDERLKKLSEDSGARIAELEGRLAKLSGTNQELTIGRNFSDSEFVREELTLTPSKARQIYGSHFEVDEEGKVVAYDKPKGAAERTMIVDDRGGPASFAEAIKKIVEGDPEHDQLIRSRMKNGSGSATETGKKAAKVKLTGMDKIRGGIKTLPVSGQPNL